jgi:2-polyprenyl-6-methoxyphenol hydroxylase-like FAD-dependent oxidoreductase
VEVCEKRPDYTRNTWFDLEPEPWSHTQKYLRAWGVEFQHFEHVRHDYAEQVFTIRAQNLERFLAKVALLLGISIRFEWTFLEFCPSRSPAEQPFALFATPSDASTAQLSCADVPVNHPHPNSIPCDMLLGADGTRSAVRTFAGADFVQQDTFRAPNNHQPLTVPGLSQSTVIVNVKPKDHECPELRTDAEGNILNPYYPAFVIEGVTAVFKVWLLLF